MTQPVCLEKLGWLLMKGYSTTELLLLAQRWRDEPERQSSDRASLQDALLLARAERGLPGQCDQVNVSLRLALKRNPQAPPSLTVTR